jgi:uncharacterized membrane protein
LIQNSNEVNVNTEEGVPAGWTYNPSDWRKRVPLILGACCGFCIASYLALYQSGIMKQVWEPFFGSGSLTVLNSPVSTLLPIPDAAVGALFYLADIIAGSIGGKTRWQTKPWVVICFGCAVLGLGGASIVLVILQPIKYHAWCTLCLCSALTSILLVGPAMAEILATLQHLGRVKRCGLSLWRNFWGVA